MTANRKTTIATIIACTILTLTVCTINHREHEPKPSAPPCGMSCLAKVSK